MEAEENPGMFLHAHCLHSADNSKTKYFPWQQTLTDITWKISRKVILVAPKYSSDGIILLILEMLLNLLFIAFLICSVNMGAIKKKTACFAKGESIPSKYQGKWKSVS